MIKKMLIVVSALTVAALIIWQATGGDYYTKFEVVERETVKPDSNDPLAAAGFYDGDTQTRTTTRSEFRFGLLPTPSGLFDKHIVSVATFVTPLWALSLGFLWLNRRRMAARKVKQEAN